MRALDPAFIARLDPLRRHDHRRLFLRRGHRQFERRGLADVDRNGRGRRLHDRPGLVVGFRIGVAALGRQAGDLGRRRSVRVGVSGSSRSRFNSSARRIAASMRNCRHSGCSSRAIIAPRIGTTLGVNCACDAVRRVERQDQEHNGEEYAAYWENPKDRQHRLCITESAKTPKTISIITSHNCRPCYTHDESMTMHGTGRP